MKRFNIRKDVWINRPVSVLFPFMSKRAKAVVQATRVHIIRDLMQYEPAWFLKQENCSKRTVDELQRLLVARFGCGLSPIGDCLKRISMLQVNNEISADEREIRVHVELDTIREWTIFVGEDESK